MLTAPLPKLVNPLKMVDQRAELEGVITLSQFERIASLLLDDSGNVEVKLSFDKDEEGLRVITGSIAGEMPMRCERCLEPVCVEVSSDVKLALAFSEESAKNLPSYYDPLVLEDNELRLWVLVEDELILNLPLVAMHPETECELGFIPTAVDNETRVEDDKEANPFAVLSELKGQRPK